VENNFFPEQEENLPVYATNVGAKHWLQRESILVLFTQFIEKGEYDC